MNVALTELCRRVLRRWFSWRMRRLLDAKKAKLTRLGSASGGWSVPTSKLRPGATAVCVGAGEDIIFDVELNKKGVTVFTVDPTPRARLHVGRVLAAAASESALSINNSTADLYDLRGFDQRRFTFLDVGLWNEDTSKRFFAPRNPNSVSHSVVNLQHTTQWFEAKCMTLRTVCNTLRINNIDILKLDVEGAEYAVLRNMVETGFLPPVVCVEFDEAANPSDLGVMKRIAGSIRLLKQSGYTFLYSEHCNALFVRENRFRDPDLRS